jgi:hypothetical protein
MIYSRPRRQWLSPQMKGEPFHLLLDSYSTHRTMDIKAFAFQLRITLHYTSLNFFKLL